MRANLSLIRGRLKMKNKRILIAGAGGFVGSYLLSSFLAAGAEVLTLTRREGDKNKIFWAPEKGELDGEKLEGLDAIINLAGESIFGYWTKSKKERILKSRLDSVRTLVSAVKRLKNQPKVFISTSAVGYYGTNPNGICDEASPQGGGFLAEVCKAWEGECAELSISGVRVVNPRFGIVLDSSGGMLKNLESLAKFKITLNFMSKGEGKLPWISLKDLLAATLFCLENEGVSGAVNFVEPDTTSIFEINEILRRRFKTLFNFRLPKPFAKFLLGEMAEALLLSSAKVEPRKLLEAGFSFSASDVGALIAK